MIWKKIEKSGKVLFQPLEVAGTHIPHIFISHPALEWPTEAWNSQFLFPSNENIQGSPPCLYHSFTTSTTYFFHALTHTYTYTHIVLDLRKHGYTHAGNIYKYTYEANVRTGCPLTLVFFRYESRIPNWTGSGKRKNERAKERPRQWYQEEIPAVISAIHP